MPTCGAKTRRGTPCERRVREGAKRCRTHGGASPQAKHAAERRRLQARAGKRLAGMDVQPVEDPIRELLQVTGEVRTLTDLLAKDFERNRDAATVDAYGRALERLSRLLVDVNRLGLEDRRIQLEEARLKNVAGAVKSVLLDHGIEADDPAVKRALRFYLTGEGDKPQTQPQPTLPSGRHHARVRDDACRELLGRGDDEAATLVTVADVREALARAQEG